MRIIAGKYKGLTIKSLQGGQTRPTTDRVREAVASSIISLRANGFADAKILDAFAGSGAMGLEALSRGAAHCTFFEKNLQAAKIVEENIKRLNISKKDYLLCISDVFKSIGVLTNCQFDLVFLDPPYKISIEKVYDLVENLQSSRALADGCLLVYEHAKEVLPKHNVLTSKNYGNTAISYLKL